MARTLGNRAKGGKCIRLHFLKIAVSGKRQSAEPVASTTDSASIHRHSGKPS